MFSSPPSPSVLVPVLLLLAGGVPGSTLVPECSHTDINLIEGDVTVSQLQALGKDRVSTTLYMHPEADFQGVSLWTQVRRRIGVWFPLARECFWQKAEWWEIKVEMFTSIRLSGVNTPGLYFSLGVGDCNFMCQIKRIDPSPSLVYLNVSAHGPSRWRHPPTNYYCATVGIAQGVSITLKDCQDPPAPRPPKLGYTTTTTTTVPPKRDSIPSNRDPITSKPTTSKPTTSEPTTSKPTTSKPTISKPTTSKPTTSYAAAKSLPVVAVVLIVGAVVVVVVVMAVRVAVLLHERARTAESDTTRLQQETSSRPTRQRQQQPRPQRQQQQHPIQPRPQRQQQQQRPIQPRPQRQQQQQRPIQPRPQRQQQQQRPIQPRPQRQQQQQRPIQPRPQQQQQQQRTMQPLPQQQPQTRPGEAHIYECIDDLYIDVI
ncbi:mediator of RNA polymerase II transcription subunit 12-like [Eriocheir sinensis]|uniref:mediator of RNA polymerase II transcription subunit 12-like n=1 Tax=Eriocheir sinensis TaxID=95602 RepID=UPI0021CA9C74|nr:mediator of RNA polymerase II transcription subunit 12-like [Eriocheir sinensis]